MRACVLNTLFVAWTEGVAKDDADRNDDCGEGAAGDYEPARH